MRRRCFVPVMLVAGLLTARRHARRASHSSPSSSARTTSFVDRHRPRRRHRSHAFNFDFAFDPTVVGTPDCDRGNIFAGVRAIRVTCLLLSRASPPDRLIRSPGRSAQSSSLDCRYLARRPLTGGRTTRHTLTFLLQASGRRQRGAVPLERPALRFPVQRDRDAIIGNGVVTCCRPHVRARTIDACGSWALGARSPPAAPDLPTKDRLRT